MGKIETVQPESFEQAAQREANLLLENYAPGKVGTPQGNEEIKAFLAGARWAQKRTDAELKELKNFRDIGEIDRGGALMILKERRRQINVEGWTPEHDDEHDAGELADAAACYAMNAQVVSKPHEHGCAVHHAPSAWPWSRKWWKPSTPIRMLVKAGALIAAEIDRRLRAGETP